MFNAYIKDIYNFKNETKTLEEKIGVPVKNLKSGQAYQILEDENSHKENLLNFETVLSSIYGSKSLDGVSMRCGFNKEILSLYSTDLDRKLPLEISDTKYAFVQM